MDLCLVIDSSGSIRDYNPPSGHPDNWAIQLRFLSDLIADLDVSQDKTRIAALVFSETSSLVFSLDRYNSVSDMQQAIMNIPYMEQSTNTPGALEQAGSQCFNPETGDRDAVPNMILLITDGVPFPPERRRPAIEVARTLKDNGIIIAATGITSVVDSNFLRDISSSHPVRGHNFFMTPNFDTLNTIRGDVIQDFCTAVEGNQFLYPNFIGIIWHIHLKSTTDLYMFKVINATMETSIHLIHQF